MNASEAVILISKLFGFALLLQCLEIIALSRNATFLKIWSFQNIKGSLPAFKNFFSKVYSKKGFKNLLFIQLLLVIVSFFYFSPFLIFFITFIHLLICIRFRGNFNGGSDMMVFVIATGLIIGGKLGLIYISIHTCYSYFKAGIVKILQPSWRTGLSISQFLGISLYSDVQILGAQLKSKKLITLSLSALTLAFELSIPVLFIFPKTAYFYFAAAMLFHFMNYLVFGLNRFFWIWLAAWPAVIYCGQLIKS